MTRRCVFTCVLTVLAHLSALQPKGVGAFYGLDFV